MKGWSVVKTLMHSHNVEGQGRLKWGGNRRNLRPQRAGLFKYWCRVNLAKGTEKIDLILVSQATAGKGNQEVLRRSAVGSDHYPICMGL